MAKLNEVHTIVLNILTEKPETRGDDYLLIYEVLKVYNVANYETDYLLINHKALNLPSFETITRCRRKIQADNPELTGEAMRKQRKTEEKDFIQYAINY